MADDAQPRRTREPLPAGAWGEARAWWKIATKNPRRIASFHLRVTYVGGGSSAIENSPRTRRQAEQSHD